METPVEKIMQKIKNNPVVTLLIIIGIIVISIAKVTGAIEDIWNLTTKVFSSKTAIPKEISKPTPPTSKNENISENDDIEILISTVMNIGDDYYASLQLKNGIGLVSGGVNGAQLARLISVSNISDDYYCADVIRYASKYLHSPVTRDDIKSILSSISDNYYQERAAEALYESCSRR